MKVDKLGYLGIDATDLPAWRTFARDYVGFGVRDLPGGRLGLRMDARPFALLLEPASDNGLGLIGLEVADPAALAQVADEVRAAGITVHEASGEELALREVAAMVWAHDPDGHRVEWYYGPRACAEPFVPGRPIGGFRTGRLGIGHLAMMTPQLAEMERFWFGLVGFRLSDFMEGDVTGRWAHVNPRHHTLALVAGPQRLLHHVMVEYEFIDDVGRLYDKALQTPEIIQTTLGRHSNDHMLSFYSRTPGGFLIETGWGGRLIEDESAWTPQRLWCMSIWGHERHWQTPEMRARLRADNEEASRRGVVFPVPAEHRPGFALPGQ
jgi:2,3-dihydroxybiphenyl 1,2-dioxygenase